MSGKSKRLSPDPNRICSVEGCQKRAKSKGYCQTHYMRLRRHGDVGGCEIRQTPDYRGWLSAHKNYSGDDCLRWPFGFNSAGYPVLYIGKKAFLAHRHMCEAAYGQPTIKRPHAAHGCGNEWCVNPKHLRWASPAENMADKKLHGTHLVGSRHSASRLSEAEAREIKQSNARTGSLARKFAVSPSVISSIRSGKAWRHV